MNQQLLLLIRRDFRRRWGGRRSRRPALVLLAILVVQAVVSVAASKSMPILLSTGSTQALAWAFSALGSLGFPPLSILDSGFSLFPESRVYAAVQVALAIPAAATRFLMPAYAATSIAPERESRRLHELLLAGLRPGQILMGLGIAAVGPFMALTLVGSIVGAAVYFAGIYAWSVGPRPLAGGGATTELTAMARHAIWTAPLFAGLQAATLVSISALCRRTVQAIAACYAVVFVAPLLVGTAINTTLLYFLKSPAAMLKLSLALTWFWLGLDLVVLVVLVRLALPVVSYPDEQRRAGSGAPVAS